MHLRMCYVFMTQNGACLCSTFGQRCLWGGGKENIVEHKNYKRVSACGILCQDMMLDDKILLKCEGGGLGYEMPNGFAQLCSLNMVFIPSWELRPSEPMLTVKHLSSLLPDSKCWHGSIQNSEWYFGWCLPGITRSQCLSPCQRMVLIRTVARCFEQALKYCFSSFSFGVLHRTVCIHLIRGKAASSLLSAEPPQWEEPQFSSGAWIGTDRAHRSSLHGHRA